MNKCWKKTISQFKAIHNKLLYSFVKEFPACLVIEIWDNISKESKKESRVALAGQCLPFFLGLVQGRAVQCSAVQCSTVQCSVVRCSAVLVKNSALQYSIVQFEVLCAIYLLLNPPLHKTNEICGHCVDG